MLKFLLKFEKNYEKVQDDSAARAGEARETETLRKIEPLKVSLSLSDFVLRAWILLKAQKQLS